MSFLFCLNKNLHLFRVIVGYLMIWCSLVMAMGVCVCVSLDLLDNIRNHTKWRPLYVSCCFSCVSLVLYSVRFVEKVFFLVFSSYIWMMIVQFWYSFYVAPMNGVATF